MKQRGAHPYADIIGLPRPVSATRPRMPARDRAAQFAPFASLTGYDAVIREAARYTGARATLDEDQKLRLNDCLVRLLARADRRPCAAFTYFIPDAKKAGGVYETVTDSIEKYDPISRCLHLTGGVCIPIDDIYDIVPC